MRRRISPALRKVLTAVAVGAGLWLVSSTFRSEFLENQKAVLAGESAPPPAQSLPETDLRRDPAALAPPSMPKQGSPTPLSEAWQLTEEFSFHFGLSAGQHKELNAAFAQAISRLDDLELQHLFIVAEGSSSTEFRIEPFAEEGELVRDGLRMTLAEILGSKSGALEPIWKAVEDRARFERMDFGRQSRWVKVETARFGKTAYVITASNHLPEEPSRGGGTGGMEVYSEERAVDEIPQRYRHLVESLSR